MRAGWVTHIYFFNPCCSVSSAIVGVGISPPPALQFVLHSAMVAGSWALQKSILTSDGQLWKKS
jgi:hypothetical protein